MNVKTIISDNMNQLQKLQSHLHNSDIYGISISGKVGSGKTSLIKNIISKFKETSFRVDDDIIILSNKNEYEGKYISSSHIKLSPTMLNAFMSSCVINHKVPNLIIDNTHSLSEFKKLFNAISKLPRYSLNTRTIIFDDVTFIIPANLSFRSMHDFIPIFIFQNIKSLPPNLKELIIEHSNEIIKFN